MYEGKGQAARQVCMEWVGDVAVKRQFERFAAETSDLLLRTGYLMTGDARDAEDLVQETFLRVARRWHKVRLMDHPAAYARRVLINLVLRDADRRSRRKAELRPGGIGLGGCDAGAARALRQVDDLAEFRWALAQLPARQRAVLVLRYWADLPVAEVAGILGCSEGTVTSTASRAAARLAQALTYGESPAPESATSAGERESAP
jgi:RNA polymerase sigma-70 factor (sigma-E family)